MTVGVPGTGIGGLFYLASALLLPVRGVIRRMRGAAVSWRGIIRPAGLGFGVLLGIWGTGWLLGLLVGPLAEPAGLASQGGAELRRHYENLVRWGALLAGFGTLAAVLLAVQIARLLVRSYPRS